MGGLIPGAAPGQFSAPVGVAVDGRGDVYVTEQGFNAGNLVHKLSPTGQRLARWGA